MPASNDNLVVFEQLEYGSAIHVMFENWRTLGQLSRLELLSGDRSGFDRIIHRTGWEKRLTVLIQKNRDRPDAAA